MIAFTLTHGSAPRRRAVSPAGLYVGDLRADQRNCHRILQVCSLRLVELQGVGKAVDHAGGDAGCVVPSGVSRVG